MLGCKPRPPPRSAGASGSEDHAPLRARRVMGRKALWKKLRSVFGDPVKWAITSDQDIEPTARDARFRSKIDLHVGLVWQPPEADITRRTAPSI